MLDCLNLKTFVLEFLGQVVDPIDKFSNILKSSNLVKVAESKRVWLLVKELHEMLNDEDLDISKSWHEFELIKRFLIPWVDLLKRIKGNLIHVEFELLWHENQYWVSIHVFQVP